MKRDISVPGKEGMKAGNPRWPAPIHLTLLVFLTLSACTKRAAPPPGPAPEKVNGSENATADVGRGRGYSMEDMGFEAGAEKPVTLPPLYFGLNQSTPLPGQTVALRALVTETPKYQACRIMGHTCPIGETLYNASLGEQRAQAVLAYLRDAGVRTREFEVISYGEEQPVAFTPDEYHLNRRVVVECSK